jgi:ornithine cyclodeaminase/alanine dehydrogenase-like protein (mu-crystallin family)
MTGQLTYIDAGELQALLPMPDAIAALEDAFGAVAGSGPPRSHITVPAGDLLLMPASSPEGVGVKLVTVAAGNPARGLPLIHGLYVLFDAGTLAPVAVIDGAAMTGLRTAAVSGLATRYLARHDASRLVVFGAGTQARSHIAAMRAVRPIAHVTVVSRTAERAEALVAQLRSGGLDAQVGTPDAVRDADLVCTCTTSPTPVFTGDLLPDGAHVNAIGAYKPDTRELDTTTMGRARVVVEQRDAALAEAGDLLLAITEGALTPSDIVADLADVVTGAAVRRSDDDITVFKSVGLALEDLAVVAAAVARR